MRRPEDRDTTMGPLGDPAVEPAGGEAVERPAGAGGQPSGTVEPPLGSVGPTSNAGSAPWPQDETEDELDTTLRLQLRALAPSAPADDGFWRDFEAAVLAECAPSGTVVAALGSDRPAPLRLVPAASGAPVAANCSQLGDARSFSSDQGTLPRAEPQSKARRWGRIAAYGMVAAASWWLWLAPHGGQQGTASAPHSPARQMGASEQGRARTSAALPSSQWDDDDSVEVTAVDPSLAPSPVAWVAELSATQVATLQQDL